MKRTMGIGLAAVALAGGVGAWFFTGRGGPSPVPITEAVQAPIATGDSVALAEFALRRCRLATTQATQACYEEVFLAVTQQNRIRLAMDALSVLGRLDTRTVANGHDLTHVVGINAWTPGEDVGAVYESCTGLYQSGCYHGVVQAYLDANGTDSATVSRVCNLIKAAETNLWLRFQCVHGIGHGLVNNLAMHLPKALAGCDWLVNGWDASSCYGGAFMEFIVAGRGQAHHPAKRAAADSAQSTEAHGEHQHHEGADTFAVRNKSDPLYPCSVIGEKYQPACYGMQAGIIYETVGPDFGKIAEACDGAPVMMRPHCYQGIGTYLSGVVVRNSEKAITRCNEGHPTYRRWCFVGVVKNFIDVTAQPDDGFAFCRLIHGQPVEAVSCYVAVGEQIAVLYQGTPERSRECAKAGAEYVGACRYGAVLSFERPANLPVLVPVS
jgi:hypothetical protein